MSKGRRLNMAYGAGSKNAQGITVRGEFVFVADGPGGFKVYDRANILKIRIAGNFAYIISATTGLHVVNISCPKSPRLVASMGSPDIIDGRSLSVQFRYCLVVDKEDFKIIDITKPESPEIVLDSYIGLKDARDIYPMRTYAYVPAGREGLAIIDIEKMEEPFLVQKYDAGGQINDSSKVNPTSLTLTKQSWRSHQLLLPEIPSSPQGFEIVVEKIAKNFKLNEGEKHGDQFRLACMAKINGSVEIEIVEN